MRGDVVGADKGKTLDQYRMLLSSEAEQQSSLFEDLLFTLVKKNENILLLQYQVNRKIPP